MTYIQIFQQRLKENTKEIIMNIKKNTSLILLI
jgi:hypothetical protein